MQLGQIYKVEYMSHFTLNMINNKKYFSAPIFLFMAHENTQIHQKWCKPEILKAQ